MPTLTELQTNAHQSVLCWLATVDQHGQPNVSPKEIFAIIDEHHLVIAHIASPQSIHNIQHNSSVCVSFIDVFVQKGYKIYGEAQIILPKHTDFDKWTNPLSHMVAGAFDFQATILIKIKNCTPIVAPSYRFKANQVTEQSQTALAMQRYRIQPLDKA